MDLRLTLGYEKMVADVYKLEKGNTQDKLNAEQRHTLWWHYMEEERIAPERFIQKATIKLYSVGIKTTMKTRRLITIERK